MQPQTPHPQIRPAIPKHARPIHDAPLRIARPLLPRGGPVIDVGRVGIRREDVGTDDLCGVVGEEDAGGGGWVE